jgi:hypothetical protein
MARVYRWGDWGQARTRFQGLAFRLQAAADRGLWAEAQAAAQRIKRNIYSQNYPHVPLSEWQTRDKANAGQDPRILIADGEYVRAIRAIHLGRGAYGVGIAADDKKNADKGVMHEWGGVNNLGHTVPARPHYRVELERIQGGGLQTLRSYLASALGGKAFVSSVPGSTDVIGVDGLSDLEG